MAQQVALGDRDPHTPDDVVISLDPREPQRDPTAGVTVGTDPQAQTCRHRLVAIGDSLTHGFQSGAIFNTDLSYPAIIAWELGCFDTFRYPTYHGNGGLPLNLELLLRDLEERYGPQLNVWETPRALFRVRQFMDEAEDYWKRGPGATPPQPAPINHNLAVYGWDLRDALGKTFETCHSTIRSHPPSDNFLSQVVEDSGDRAALRVYPCAPDSQSLTVFQAARKLGEEKAADGSRGIETLIVALGANNALESVVRLSVVWSDEGYDDLQTKQKRGYTVWRPIHFEEELHRVVTEVATINARHVIWCTVPHVTIAPIARGVGTKIRLGSRYFPYYTRPWITDRQFDLDMHPHITTAQARAVDCAIDQYNDAIVAVVRNARAKGKDWYVLEAAGILDRLAQRRYLDDPTARPSWWRPYPLPAELQALTPVPDARFVTCDADGARATGGLFSLDGVHPTTVGYGILAQEAINIMHRAGVEFRSPNGAPRSGPVTVDFARLIRRDSLITRPPAYITPGLEALGWLEDIGAIWRGFRAGVIHLVG